MTNVSKIKPGTLNILLFKKILLLHFNKFFIVAELKTTSTDISILKMTDEQALTEEITNDILDKWNLSFS